MIVSKTFIKINILCAPIYSRWMRNIANIVKIRIIQAFLLRMTTNDPGEAADGKKTNRKTVACDSFTWTKSDKNH